MTTTANTGAPRDENSSLQREVDRLRAQLEHRLFSNDETRSDLEKQLLSRFVGLESQLSSLERKTEEARQMSRQLKGKMRLILNLANNISAAASARRETPVCDGADGT
ncbi:uncharacterized protein LOC134540540 [Bacillus rossius redtenbacheri]|uniref:uncharacterized protein LOC134540540 n=1 Tax=Bacillus rossius redtenbacheri TaxID=93214 RepID=UPI002FDE762A